MKITSILALSAALIGFSNCTTDTPTENAIEQEQAEQEMENAGSADSVASMSAAPQPETMPGQEIAPVEFNSTETSTSPVTATPVTSVPDGAAKTGAPKPNPPHGQPGHVCGQPVTTGNTASQMPATQPGINPVQVPAPQPVAPPTGGATAGLNPAHGQPGHVCGVAVGAPLPKN